MTHLAGFASVGVSDQLEEVNTLVADTLKGKEKYLGSVRREVTTRDLSAEKIRNALGLKVEIPRFTGHDSLLDIYTRSGQNLKNSLYHMHNDLFFLTP